ncbi:Hvo_1808 family surface protein [Natrinema sp. 1APR25-10V2]|uniref:Hvo_1808 family surface protein n=1 Tax=Natrinema sp. 1APR25-10V2 TaxID=2951081 RepID=UPI002875E7F2|nr:Hvo_1808 family surface protein [Natrinema sp. 1APR25-10V2]MDS0473570.1 Hvo_1808 family surface protein [Natrinema sp. 1APR25-10V2]
MEPTHPRSSVALFSVMLVAVLVTGGVAGPALAESTPADPAEPTTASDSTPALTAGSTAATNAAAIQAQTERPENPTTNGTVGYVSGYWYDDPLPVDDQSNAVVDEDELAPVVYRSMARVELIRNKTFETEVTVDVVSREEFRRNNDGRFGNLTGAERLEQNVAYEALFMVDRETAATDATESLYGGAVDGYYDPETDEIVIVSENPETPELNELTLGHELVHALQDQHYNLSALAGTTQDRELAKNGLVEGDAKRVELEYESRCGYAWNCLEPSSENRNRPSDINWGIYFTVYQPYSDGPDYVNRLRHQEPGWSAVDAAYDDPPTTTSAVIHGTQREPANVSVPDRSSDGWRQFTVDGEPASDTVGEAGMVAMFTADAFGSSRDPVIDQRAFLADDRGYQYNHTVTNGWAGDELVVYANDDDVNASTLAAAGRAGYVWRTQWQSATDAEQFADGYLQLLESHDAEPVDGRRNTFRIDDGGYAGAYAIEQDGTTATIVRAPSVDELSNVESGAAPEGEDTLELSGSDGSDEIPGFGPLVATGVLAIALLGTGARIAVNGRRS